MFIKSRVRTTVWLLLSLAPGLVASSFASQYRIVVHPAHCGRLADSQRHWLGSDWQPYQRYTRICPIQNSKHKTVLFLVSVHADLYYAAQPGQSVSQIQMPDPLLFLPSGKVLGTLPYNFPDDPPAELRVTFVQWERDFPRRIELFLTDPRASGNRSLPSLLWNETKKKFVSTKEDAE